MATFLTLTYSDKFIPTTVDKETGEILQTLKKKDLQDYFKRVRKENPKLKYFAVGEYGENTDRPHYHAIVFNTENSLLDKKWSKENQEIGFKRFDPVNQAAIHYVTKYVINKHLYCERKRQEQFAMMSKKLGINYVIDNKTYHQDKLSTTVIYKGGQKQTMPRYFKEKIFTEEQIKMVGTENRKLANQHTKQTDYAFLMSERKAINIKALKGAKSSKY